eukprot:TRINITY_DN29134_c0_g1_i1.p1 TRINITY_DN29134_c0_g1~~TRINITY_DN29134_c0_g1_i1.p1  ORF type:complete len:253 (+),score=60.28 TRINITY_DN29134_c0_g1_i1:75-833(+)
MAAVNVLHFIQPRYEPAGNTFLSSAVETALLNNAEALRRDQLATNGALEVSAIESEIEKTAFDANGSSRPKLERRHSFSHLAWSHLEIQENIAAATFQKAAAPKPKKAPTSLSLATALAPAPTPVLLGSLRRMPEQQAKVQKPLFEAASPGSSTDCGSSTPTSISSVSSASGKQARTKQRSQRTSSKTLTKQMFPEQPACMLIGGLATTMVPVEPASNKAARISKHDLIDSLCQTGAAAMARAVQLKAQRND